MTVAAARISYDGEAVHDGSMDVRDLAPALLEIGGLCERANEILNGDRTRISVNVKADFRPGSFIIDFEVVQGIPQQIRDFLFSGGVQDAKYILELLGLGGVSVTATFIALYKVLRGRKADKTEKLKSGKILITLSDGATLEVPVELLLLYNDEVARARMEGALRPLMREGIETFEVMSGERIVESVTKAEAVESFETRRLGDDLKSITVADDVYTTALEIIKVPFRDRLVWNFNRGNQRISAEMKDPGFLQRHRVGEESFRTGDVLLVRMRTHVFHTPDGLKATNEILEVLGRPPRPTQLTIEGADSKG